MKTQKIVLIDGYAEIPANVRVIDISSNGKICSVGILADRKHKVPPIAVASDRKLCRLCADEEDTVIKTVTKELPEYQKIWHGVDDTGIDRLGLFPLEMFNTLTEQGKCDYRLVREL